ncbi:ECF transporter S component [Mariniluteicoccus flavus]
MTTPRGLVPFGIRSALVLALASVIGVLAFTWPLVVRIEQTAARSSSHSHDAPWLFALLLPLLAAVVLAQLSDGGMDAKVVALLGMLTAVVAGLRALSPGTAGLEPGFFMLVVAGFAFGPGFGFVLGALGIFAGGLMTGGIGPWVPFQMFASGWVALGAGLLPHPRRESRWGHVAMLAAYALVAGLAYGVIMNLWFWPFATFESSMSFVPGDAMGANLERYARFWVLTSIGWDLPRGIVSALLVLAFARPLLRAFARVSRKAAFGEKVEFGS